jgi:nucleotide-binding universal stress UspA family protein
MPDKQTMPDEQPNSLRTILVALDGSTRAECALPLAERLASALGSRLLLVRVVEPSAHLSDLAGEIPPWRVNQELSAIEDEATQEYLARVAATVRSHGIDQVTIRAARGQPASVLLALLSSGQADLVVMASHGYGGVQRALFGSVADRLIQRSSVPILVVHPEGDERRYLRLARALVPLDGSAVAEDALRLVRLLAGPLLRHVTLVRVVNPELPASELTAAQNYLAATSAVLAAAVSERGCVVEDALLVGYEAEQILRRSQDGYDLIILCTHGRSGLQRWLLGSVAQSVVHGAHIPTFLLPAPKQASEKELDRRGANAHEEAPVEPAGVEGDALTSLDSVPTAVARQR